jgi:hypothetical protein
VLPTFVADIDAAVTDAVGALLRRQNRDGFWRDFMLPPGRSDAWATAWTGWGIAHATRSVHGTAALQRATRALWRGGGPFGWGYNAASEPDADSTAWAIRLLSIVTPGSARAAVSILDRYLDPAGEAHTFLDPGSGTWNEAHSDVTAVVGLALVSARGARDRIERLRSTILVRSRNRWPPKTFWWSIEIYGLAWTLAFLAASGGVPTDLASASREWMERQEFPADPLGQALEVLAWTVLGIWDRPRVVAVICRLLETYSSDGWRGSTALLVPPQRRGSPQETERTGPHADDGIMTTSLVVASLARWRRAARTRHATPILHLPPREIRQVLWQDAWS